MHQMKGQMCQAFGKKRFPLKGITYRYCSSAVDRFLGLRLLHLSRFLSIFFLTFLLKGHTAQDAKICQVFG